MHEGHKEPPRCVASLPYLSRSQWRCRALVASRGCWIWTRSHLHSFLLSLMARCAGVLRGQFAIQRYPTVSCNALLNVASSAVPVALWAVAVPRIFCHKRIPATSTLYAMQAFQRSVIQLRAATSTLSGHALHALSVAGEPSVGRCFHFSEVTWKATMLVYVQAQ
jgi:hypothetical protein